MFGAESANIVQQLIDAKADINARNAADDTALMLAIRSGREDLVKLLLDAGINLNLTNNDGDSALTIAAKVHGAGRRQSYYYSTRPESLVEQLVASGARVRAINKTGESVLTLMSAKAGSDELPIIELLIERAACEAPGRFVQVEDLLRALRRTGGQSSAATVKALIAAGGNVNGRSEEGEALLIVAVEESGNAEVVELLLAAGADVNVRDRNGDTPLLLAIRQYLSGPKAQIRKALRQDPRVIDLLLSFRANPLARTRDGLAALDLARQSGNEKLISQIQRAQP
jgi:ankyrin repeat protein